ncbi:hypothetical protein D9M68_765520 [compost metagenome]
MPGQEFHAVVLRLQAHCALVGDELDAELAYEQAEPFTDSHEQALDDADVGFAPGVEHQVVPGRELQVPATGQGHALRCAEQRDRCLELV